MIKEVVQDAINKQITKEMYSSNLYLAMSAYFSSINLNGFANWMRIQVQEEMFHALKFFDYVLDRGGKAAIGMVNAPQTKWDTPLACFEEAYVHEQMISESINQLANLAISEGDHATYILCQWFITEQVEEEKSVSEIVDRLKLAGESRGGLFMLDNELKSRVFVPPGRN
jgi:ferritin